MTGLSGDDLARRRRDLSPAVRLLGKEPEPCSVCPEGKGPRALLFALREDLGSALCYFGRLSNSVIMQMDTT